MVRNTTDECKHECPADDDDIDDADVINAIHQYSTESVKPGARDSAAGTRTKTYISHKEEADAGDDGDEEGEEQKPIPVQIGNRRTDINRNFKRQFGTNDNASAVPSKRSLGNFN